jgi:hypothetical protein
MTDPRDACAKTADVLLPGVPYVRGWARAKQGDEALAEQLTALGLAAHFPSLKADVNVHGNGVVRLGIATPEVVQLLADALARGLAREIADHSTNFSEKPRGEPFAG